MTATIKDRVIWSIEEDCLSRQKGMFDTASFCLPDKMKETIWKIWEKLAFARRIHEGLPVKAGQAMAWEWANLMEETRQLRQDLMNAGAADWKKWREEFGQTLTVCLTKLDESDNEDGAKFTLELIIQNGYLLIAKRHEAQCVELMRECEEANPTLYRLARYEISLAEAQAVAATKSVKESFPLFRDLINKLQVFRAAQSRLQPSHSMKNMHHAENGKRAKGIDPRLDRYVAEHTPDAT